MTEETHSTFNVDYEYSPSKWSPRMSATEVINAHIKVITKESEENRANVDFDEVSYGDSQEQKLHIFGAKTLPADSPIVVYIHGGYWHLLSLSLSGFMVKPLVDSGVVVISIGYELAPKVGMTEILSQIKKAISFILHVAKRKESRGVYLVGHSAGAHLASMALSVDWLEETMISSGLIKGALLVSGIYDLRPLVPSYVNEPLQMTDEEAWENSPENVLKSITAKSKGREICVVVAEHDPTQFHKQANLFHKGLLEGGVTNAKFIKVPDVDHFNVIENLSDSNFSLTQELLQMVKSGQINGNPPKSFASLVNNNPEMVSK